MVIALFEQGRRLDPVLHDAVLQLDQPYFAKLETGVTFDRWAAFNALGAVSSRDLEQLQTREVRWARRYKQDRGIGNLFVATGFPFRAFSCMVGIRPSALKITPLDLMDVSNFYVADGVSIDSLSGALTGSAVRPRVLAYRPIWSGLAANTCVYLAVYLVLAFGTLVLRVGLRVKRGGCGRCGYDMVGGGPRCPECGHVPRQSMV